MFHHTEINTLLSYKYICIMIHAKNIYHFITILYYFTISKHDICEYLAGFQSTVAFTSFLFQFCLLVNVEIKLMRNKIDV